MQAAVAQATERFGGLDVVMANAGIATYGTVLNVDPAAFYRLIDINVNGVFNTVRAACRRSSTARATSWSSRHWPPTRSRRAWPPMAPRKPGRELRQRVAVGDLAPGRRRRQRNASWIDTPMVRDAKSDLPAFKEMLRRMPPPLGKTTTIDKCGTAFAKGIEKRKRRVFCPGWCAGCAWVSHFCPPTAASMPFGATPRNWSPNSTQVAALGRSVSARFTDGDE